MANSKIYFKSEAGGTTTLSRDTSANSGNLVLPAGGNVASVDTAVTDNAIARFDSTTGKLQNSGVIIDDNGNVGIGTSNPATALNVNTASETKCGLYLQKNLSSVALIGAESTWLGAGTSNNAVLAAYGTNSLILGTNAAERMRIDSSGNVGIGTSSPIDKLGVKGNIAISSLVGTTYTDGSGVLFYRGADNTQMGYIGFGGASTPFEFVNSKNNGFNFYNGDVLQKTPYGLGYGTGAGGTVTQLTSKSTAVTLNKPSGQIIMNNSALAAGASVTFGIYNSLVSATDTVVVNGVYGVYDLKNYRIEKTHVIAGTIGVRVTNLSGVSLSEAIPINFTIIKGATA